MRTNCSVSTLKHKFVEFIPDTLAEGVLYVALSHGTVVHRCCCGCGQEIVTPLTPTDWKLIFDGETVSLYPSIGSWSLPCRSHYWITRNRVEWAEDWPAWRVAAAEERDRKVKQGYFERLEPNAHRAEPPKESQKRTGFWTRFWRSH